ncbi:hypothetical protein QJS04_geneDACA020266 [Acorus gramineus]|uniref:Uncharacterized protein n=1 Tax=Acorus gramineus TaxID=55184 RepID=A0AAV9A3Y3_ACOGR|nr:hypothetical protein QJS04_geneDACA020266 [Acorus gramineus]
MHLYKSGIMPSYMTWTSHGEAVPPIQFPRNIHEQNLHQPSGVNEEEDEDQEIHSSSWDEIEFSSSHGNLELGVNHWKGHSLAALKVGAEELKSMILKGGGLLSVAKIYQLLARRLSGKMFLEAANYQIRHELLKKGGQLAAINLESRTALLVARQVSLSPLHQYLKNITLCTLQPLNACLSVLQLMVPYRSIGIDSITIALNRLLKREWLLRIGLIIVVEEVLIRHENIFDVAADVNYATTGVVFRGLRKQRVRDASGKNSRNRAQKSEKYYEKVKINERGLYKSSKQGVTSSNLKK